VTLLAESANNLMHYEHGQRCISSHTKLLAMMIQKAGLSYTQLYTQINCRKKCKYKHHVSLLHQSQQCVEAEELDLALSTITKQMYHSTR